MTDAAAIESIERRMRSILVVYTASFVVWGGALTALLALLPIGGTAVASEPGRPLLLGVIGVMVVFWAIWLVQLVRYVLISMRIQKDAALKAVFDDERRKLVGARAMSVGFWTVIVAAGAYFLAFAQGWFEISSPAFAIGSIWIGVSVVLGAFLYLDRDEAEV